jgi:hypothetical protein
MGNDSDKQEDMVGLKRFEHLNQVAGQRRILFDDCTTNIENLLGSYYNINKNKQKKFIEKAHKALINFITEGRLPVDYRNLSRKEIRNKINKAIKNSLALTSFLEGLDKDVKEHLSRLSNGQVFGEIQQEVVPNHNYTDNQGKSPAPKSSIILNRVYGIRRTTDVSDDLFDKLWDPTTSINFIDEMKVLTKSLEDYLIDVGEKDSPKGGPKDSGYIDLGCIILEEFYKLIKGEDKIRSIKKTDFIPELFGLIFDCYNLDCPYEQYLFVSKIEERYEKKHGKDSLDALKSIR